MVIRPSVRLFCGRATNVAAVVVVVVVVIVVVVVVVVTDDLDLLRMRIERSGPVFNDTLSHTIKVCCVSCGLSFPLERNSESNTDVRDR